MQEVNGLAALSSRSFDLADTLHIMNYRAWRKLSLKRQGVIRLGLCLIDEDTEKLSAIHGGFYSDDSNPVPEPEIDDLPRFLARTDGSYSFVRVDDGTLIFARDPLGTKPLYYARRKDSFGVASDARVLQKWFSDVQEAEPGVLYKVTETSIVQISFSPLNYDIRCDAIDVDSKEVPQTVSTLLEDSVRQRVVGRKSVVLGFSGGIDSAVLSVLASRYINVTAATVCTKDSPDYRACEGIADKLGIPLKMIVVDEKTVKDTIKRLSTLTALNNVMHASIASVVYLLAKFTRESGADALMLGQLADELFGGYARYLRYLKTSVDKASSAILNDVRNAHKLNFWRDEVASSPFTRLLLPYASPDLVRYVSSLPLHMKLNAETGERKIILREVAKRIGIDDQLAKREKKAMQFSSGIYKIVSRLQQSLY